MSNRNKYSQNYIDKKNALNLKKTIIEHKNINIKQFNNIKRLKHLIEEIQLILEKIILVI